MASEFTRKVRNIKDIKEYPTRNDNNGDVLITKGDEIYMLINDVDKVRIDNRDVEGEIKKATDLSNEAINKADKSSEDTQKVSQDLINLKSVDNTWTGVNEFTQPINGMFTTKNIDETDYNDIAKNMYKYSGIGLVTGTPLDNSPLNGATWYLIQVMPGQGPDSGYIQAYIRGITYGTGVYQGGLQGWTELADNSKVIHNTGNETSSGDKTFNGQTTLLNGNYGLQVTNSGIMKTNDAGKTWVNI